MDALISLSPWHWGALGAALIVVEILVPSTFLLWPGVSAFVIAVLLALAPGLPPTAQILAFSALAVATTIAWQMWLKQHPTMTTNPLLNRRTAALMGRKVKTTDPIAENGGALKIEDTLWRAKGVDGQSIPAGVVVEITGFDGPVLLVRPVQE